MKALDKKRYTSVDDIKRDAFALFAEGKLNTDNAILVIRDWQNRAALLTMVPQPMLNNEPVKLFIKFIKPCCDMCSNSFGILPGQHLYECPTNKCSAQFCEKCVTSVRGSPPEHKLVCLLCRESIVPSRDATIEKYLIWPSIGRLYGTESLHNLTEPSTFLSCGPIMKDMKRRQIHLRSRLETFRKRLDFPMTRAAHQLIEDVETLLREIRFILDCTEKIDRAMEERDINLEAMNQNYQQLVANLDPLCELFECFIEDRQATHNDSALRTYQQEKQEKDWAYRHYQSGTLLTEQNVENIEGSLKSLDSRRDWLMFLLETRKRCGPIDQQPLNEARDKLDALNRMIDQLDCLCDQLRLIERHVKDYAQLLRRRTQSDIDGSQFVYLLEALRIEIDRHEVEHNFPRTRQLIDAWQIDYGTEEQFKPKVLELCQHIEQDFQDLYVNQRSIRSVPYRIGLIGHTSVGKSALTKKLANLTNYSSMINLERSTFGYLQFDVCIDDDRIPISYIDIAGSIDNNASRSLGNYLELITNANCDLYLLVFDKPFDAQNQIWLEYIQTNLQRQCLLVRSKSDVAFDTFYRDVAGEPDQNGNPRSKHVRTALENTRRLAMTTFQSQILPRNVFLVAADARRVELNDRTIYGFDLEKLRDAVYNAARTDPRVARVRYLAIMASKTAINTCFRRGYIVSKTKYRLGAAVASLVPLVDEIPAFFGREEIRQAFGIHDRSSVANFFARIKNALEDYLVACQIRIPPGVLKSGRFKYLVLTDAELAQGVRAIGDSDPVRPETTVSPAAGNVTRVGVAAAGVIGNLADDAIRAAAPAAATTVRGLSIAGVVIGVFLTPITASWSFYSSGKRMDDHLHLLCDDLETVLAYFIAHLGARFA